MDAPHPHEYRNRTSWLYQPSKDHEGSPWRVPVINHAFALTSAKTVTFIAYYSQEQPVAVTLLGTTL